MKEIRICEIRAETADNEALRLVGRPIIYDQQTVIKDVFGEFNEVIKRGALDKSDITDVRLLYNHDLGRVPLARTPKTMSLTVDKDGLVIEAQLADNNEARAVYDAVKRGDLTGMSFGFTVQAGGDTYDAKTNTRTINKINKIYECSICPFPAYSQTSIEARNEIKSSSETYRAKLNAKILVNQILAKHI